MESNTADAMQGMLGNTVMMMGLSFLLGSLFTIFILVVLDMVRASRMDHAEMLEQQEQQLEDMQNNNRDAA
jgi:hypothetical protein